ncbi:hypothetical protein NFI96_029058, partial [Prochilodus magdalenae]
TWKSTMTAFLLLCLVLFPTSILGYPDPWTPDAEKKWTQGNIITSDLSNQASSDNPSVHLVLFDSQGYSEYKRRYLDKKETINRNENNQEIFSFLYDSNTNTFHLSEEMKNKEVELKNKKVKLTVLAHGGRRNVPLEGGAEEYGVEFRIDHKSPQELANVIKSFVGKVGFIPDEQMRLISCNAGTQAASNYVSDFLRDLNNMGIKVTKTVAYRSLIALEETVVVVKSMVSQYYEELLWIFEREGKPIGRAISEYLEDNKITKLSATVQDKNTARVLFTLDNNGEVQRHGYVKTDNNHQQQLESSINQQNDQECFESDFLAAVGENCQRKIERNENRRPRKRKRLHRSPSVCRPSEEEFEEDYVMKEGSLAIKDGRVEVQLVNRYSPEDTRLVSSPLKESFYMNQVKETALHTTSLEKSGGLQILENINDAMVKYGIVAGFIGAGKFFAENDTTRGAITLTQSLHGLGEMTNLNQQISRMSRDVFQKGLCEAASGLGMEETLTKISSSVERFGESAAGQFLKNIPFAGLTFQGYFIFEDSIAIKNLNRSDPEQNKYFGLEVTNLVLDVTTTVLSIAELAFPPAAVVLEPIIIGLSIVRMSLSDFYCDVVSELDKLPQGGGDFDRMIAVIAGLEEGAVDFVTGGLLRAVNQLDEEVRQNRELVRNLSNPESYYKITADDGNTSTLDLMAGILSRYGGFLTIQLLNNGGLMIQVGGVDDGKGGVKTIKESFYNPRIQNIVLGVGESPKFLYSEKSANLLWVIPVTHAKVISGEIKLRSSLFGRYYGNDKDNRFVAPQQPAEQPDLEFVIKNYHYYIYGNGGDDSFFLGPQTSELSGGEGRDLYVFPTTGSQAEIDNFSQDMLEDHLMVKAPFSRIDCIRSQTDLLLVYGPEKNRITIRHWFVHISTDHYQHMTFQSADGVMFKVVDRGLANGELHALCVPETLDKTKSEMPVSLSLVGDLQSVITVLGSRFPDTIVGNEKNNVLNGGHGADMLEGGEGADTYEIFQGQGCDTINNYAKDEKVDLVVFQVPFNRIQADLQGEGLLVFDKENISSTCVLFSNWTTGRLFQHVAFLSSDHVTFHISNDEGELTMTALMVDLSKETHGSTVNLSEPYHHLLYVMTVFDSALDDVLIGNALGNFLSCSGGRDRLQGAGGGDKYVIKSGCKRANILNFDKDHINDVLFIEHPFLKLRAVFQWPHLVLKVEESDVEVHLENWLQGKEFQHLVLQTIDGIISMLPSNMSEPEVITPFEINLSQEDCIANTKTFDLSKDPFRKVERFKAKSSSCSYSVIGNSQNNYMDPGIGNAMKYQYLMGGNGSDTYVLGHGYGYENEIDNEARDLKADHLFLDVLYKDIIVYPEPPHITLYSGSRNDSVRVRLLRYLQGPEHQHLVVKSLDGFFFQINPLSSTYKSVLSIDTSTATESCNISCAEGDEFLTVSHIYGATQFSNYITGSGSSSVIKGGNKDDYLQGNEGNERIEGNAGDDVLNGHSGDDVLLGGEGDDHIMGGAGNDLIYGGWGADRIDGGPGVDTVFFIGDVKTSTGVRVDLNSGRGEWADAENDTYTGVEGVSGTNYNDLIIGDDEDNELQGRFGNDTLIPGHGSDLLFGGPGNDLYVLDSCSGVKHINNFASDKAQDHVLLRDFSHRDACFFLLEGNLVISFSYHDPLLSLIQQNDLAVFLERWNSDDSFYQHVDFVFANDTLVDSSFFSSAAEIGPTLSELNSTSPSLYTRTASETAVEMEVETRSGLHRGDAGLRYYIKVSDELFFTDRLQWDRCQIFRPPLRGSLHLPVTRDPVALIRWTAPPSDSDPNSSRYTYVVHVKGLGGNTVRQFTTNLTRQEVRGLKPGTVYRVSLGSTIDGVKSQETTVEMKTSNVCPRFTAPIGARVVEGKMTSSGPAVVIECEQGFRRVSSPQILCLQNRYSRPCVPMSCTYQSSLVPHGSSATTECFGNAIKSMCRFGQFSPPVPVCCGQPSDALMTAQYKHGSYSGTSIAVTFHCPAGYRPSENLWLDCDLRKGQWSRPFLPSCIPIPCPDPPRDPHGRFRSLSGLSGHYKEGDILLLECDTDYHPSLKNWIACRNGMWGYFSCDPNAKLVDTQTQNFKLYGRLQLWKSGMWTSQVPSAHAEYLARFSCKSRELMFVSVSYPDLLVECSMIKLDTTGYVGNAEVNLGSGWEKICMETASAARSFCGMLFPFTGWNASQPGTSPFRTEHSYLCNDHGSQCRLRIKSRTCDTMIQCRSTCNPLPVPNGNGCGSALEGQWCSVSCDRRYKLQGSTEIQCESGGWSEFPYCMETGECGSDDDTGPHSLICLNQLWTEVGCDANAKLSPVIRPDFWADLDSWTVGEVREMMARLPDQSGITYNPDCQVDDECFPGRATVLTSDGNRKSMSELRVGDRILALDAGGELVFSEVILWLDRRPSAVERYVLLTTEDFSETLSLSPDHVTFIATSNSTAATVATMIPVFAKDLQPGHLIHRYDPITGLLVARRVTDVQESKDLGAYAPLTVQGNLIVDGHLVSCYALQCRQYLAHLPFAPYRFLHTLRSNMPFFENMFPVQREQEDEGMHWYARAWYQVGQWFGYPFGKTCYPKELHLYHYP